MDEDIDDILADTKYTPTFFNGIPRSQDYALVCFEISRSISNENGTSIVENAWMGDVAAYIVQLENKIKILTNINPYEGLK